MRLAKILLMAFVVGALAASVAPNASACEVDDPTELTLTCVRTYDQGHGDQTCEEAGYHDETVFAATGIQDVGFARVRASSTCYNSGSYGWESQTVSVIVSLYGNGYVGANVDNYEGDLEYCSVRVYTNNDVTGYQSVSEDCSR